jgi:hypothetical protein
VGWGEEESKGVLSVSVSVSSIILLSVLSK